PKAERRAHAALHHRGYDPYLPLITVRRRSVWHSEPLFPGYLFIHLDPQRPWYPIRWAPGVYHLLTVAGMPQPCAEGAVEAVQAAEALRAPEPPARPAIAPGDAVRLAAGPLAGHQGLVLSVHRDQARIAVMMLGQLRNLAVPLDACEPRGD
ncbi:MAG TPA: transcription termination/antitermination NusG family protein, partial [Steroidobacteraceae bacterium]